MRNRSEILNLKEARATREAIRDGDPLDELCRNFASALFKASIRQYHKRPVYWLLQSSRHTYGVWLFHERPNPPAYFARLKLWKMARPIVLQYGQTLK